MIKFSFIFVENPINNPKHLSEAAIVEIIKFNMYILKNNHKIEA